MDNGQFNRVRFEAAHVQIIFVGHQKRVHEQIVDGTAKRDQRKASRQRHPEQRVPRTSAESCGQNRAEAQRNPLEL